MVILKHVYTSLNIFSFVSIYFSISLMHRCFNGWLENLCLQTGRIIPWNRNAIFSSVFHMRGESSTAISPRSSTILNILSNGHFPPHYKLDQWSIINLIIFSSYHFTFLSNYTPHSLQTFSNE